ncbi:MAG: HAMP domain-containing histidine kinase [Bacteroidales bacterium]|nr:HAMP domain-containing histidine kinase [Bacteroidales bacterium]
MRKRKTNKSYLWFALLLGVVWTLLLIALIHQSVKVFANQPEASVVASYSVLAIPVIMLLFCCVRFFLGLRRQYKINQFHENMVHNMVHELKTPLTTIDLASQFLQDKSIEKDEATKDSYLRMISDESKSVRDLVDQMLTVFSSDNLSDQNKEDVFINRLLERVAGIHHLAVAECQGSVKFDLRAERDVVFGDLTHLSNAFSNLIDNAIKYRIDPLELTIGTRNEGNNIVISFADNGMGIEKSNLPLIFEPFTRFNTDNEHYVKGFGLGLDYVNHVVNYHKGTISVESELHKGSTFIVTLPLKTN